MERTILQEFKAKIGNVEVTDKHQFYATCDILDALSEKYNVEPDENFVQDLKDALHIIYYKYDEIDWSDIEVEFIYSIENSESLEELQFKVYDDDWKFSWFNENLANKEYTFTKIKSEE